MPQVISVLDDTSITLNECAEALQCRGFNPDDPASLESAALQLRRLGNNRAFLGDMIVAELAARHRESAPTQAYGPQVIVFPLRGGDFFMRANFWPSTSEPMVRAGGPSAFVFGMPHDHNFHFLTLGYFGPGYWSDYYEFDYENVAGWSGEQVDLRFVERSRLEQGKIMLYRAHRDVHRQLPADSLSISINIMHTTGAQGWLDQYGFDTEKRCITGILNRGSSEAFIHIAVGLGGAEAHDLAERFAARHPSDRMRLAAWEALASMAGDAAARDQLWHRAEGCGSLLVAKEAQARRHDLVPS